MSSVKDFLIEEYGFREYRNYDKNELDFNKFSCVLRIHEIHYLYWSEDYKAFTIAKRNEHPKGSPGKDSKPKFWDYMIIPKTIRSIEDARKVLDGVIDFNYLKVIEQ